MPVSALIAVSETPNRMPAAAPSITPWCSTGPPIRGPMISRPPIPNRPASKEIIAAWENCECAPCMAGSVSPSSHEARGGQHQAQPLAAADLEAEQPVGHHRDEHHAGGERDLDHRHRRQRQRGHVQAPAGGRDEHAQREPLRGVQQPRRAQRVAHLDLAAPRWRRGTCKKKPRLATKAQASARSMPRSRVMGRGTGEGGGSHRQRDGRMGA